ncbi:hypothetical protein BH18ACI4_BH18ACI4_13050 [soil metagenome]
MNKNSTLAPAVAIQSFFVRLRVISWNESLLTEAIH